MKWVTVKKDLFCCFVGMGKNRSRISGKTKRSSSVGIVGLWRDVEGSGYVSDGKVKRNIIIIILSNQTDGCYSYWDWEEFEK